MPSSHSSQCLLQISFTCSVAEESSIYRLFEYVKEDEHQRFEDRDKSQGVLYVAQISLSSDAHDSNNGT